MSLREETSELRRHQRQETTLQALLTENEQPFDCHLVNISVSGARINCPRRFRAGERLELTIPPFGSFPCELVWQNELLCGVKFLAAAELMAPVLAAMALYG